MTEGQVNLEAREQPGVPLVQGREPDPCVMVIFGASGDLTTRKLVPALYNMERDGLLPRNFAVVGFARSLDDEENFRNNLRENVEKHSRTKPLDKDVWNSLASRIFAHQGSYDDQQSYESLKKRCDELAKEFHTSGNLLFHSATPPATFPEILRCLKAASLIYDPEEERERWSRVIIEKPFGHDLESARELNHLVSSVLDECQIYRIDHFLGKETVQNLLVFRFGNSIFEPIWNRKYIDSVEITAAETLGIEGRGKFYEQTGIIRDMVQNHLLQMLTLFAMEQPVNFSPDEIRGEKAKVLRSISRLEEYDLAERVVLAQYEGYREEKDVAADSRVPTYSAIRLSIDNWRWQGVPFYLRTGKKLKSHVTEIVIRFLPIPTCLFGRDEVCQRIEPNTLTIQVGPKEGIGLSIATKVPGEGLSVGTVSMDFAYEDVFHRQAGHPYERLMLDAMRGDPTLFARSDEVEEAWRVVMPILEAAENPAGLTIHAYKGESEGPREADELLWRQHHRWKPLP